MQFVPKKLYYKIREVCEIVGVEAHVLRFWETAFPSLSPPKSKSGQRTYRPKDIEFLLRIRKLLYEEGYTIAGARKQLSGRSGTAEAGGFTTGQTPPETGIEGPLTAFGKADVDAGKVGAYGYAEAGRPIHGAAGEGEGVFRDREKTKRRDARPDLNKSAAGKDLSVDATPSETNRLKRVQAELENILTLLDRE
ncbi:MAG TPA: MerR family transcriptional regulator [Acidobacteriota bacterium]|nr:MerR family transcriptional regulator [Acidobacteriota bacterium]